jgi:hypothetical protein
MNWLKQLFSRHRLYNDLSDEIRAHLHEKIDELVATGMPRKEATATARREFGNATLIEEDGRDVWRWMSIENLFADARYGLRMLGRNPVFTVVGLLTIAIGIGANAAVFSVVNSVLLKPLNYPKAEELVSLHQTAPGAAGLADFENGLFLSPSMYFTYSEHNRSFQSLGVWATGTANVTGLAEPEQVRTVEVSDGVLQALGFPPTVGRWFTHTDQIPRGHETVMLSYGYWQRHFAGDRSVIGRNLMVDSRPREIVGVMAQGFRFVDTEFELIVPLAFDRGKLILAGFGYHGIARLKPGVTIAEGNADITRLLPIWMDSWTNGPGTNPHFYETWQRERSAVGGDGNDWVGDVNCVRECHEFVAGEGGVAAAGTGCAGGARCGLGTDGAGTAGRERDAGADGRCGRHGLGLRRGAISGGCRSCEFAAVERDFH